MTAPPGSDPDLHAERERYLALLEQVDMGIYRTDASGVLVFVSDQMTAILGCTRAELLAGRWAAIVHPDDRDRLGSVAEAVRHEKKWADEYRIVVGGEIRWVRASSRPLHAPDGTFRGHLGTCQDVTGLRAAVDDRHRAAVAQAAREASDAAAARMRTLVGGLAAVVWEGDARTLECTFISPQVAEMLGYPASAWLAGGGLWSSILHPADREAVTTEVTAALAEGRDFTITYRVRAADGRLVWLHDVVHVVVDGAGRAVRMQGVMLDVTEQRRHEHSTALLVRVGALQTTDRPLPERLAAFVELSTPELADLTVVALVGRSGTLDVVAASAPGRPDVLAALRALPARPIPPALAARLAAGRAFVLPGAGEDVLREVSDDESELRARLAPGVHDRLIVPLSGFGRVLGALSFSALDRTRASDAFDLELAEELGRRASLMIRADLVATRERHLRAITTALAGADTLDAVAGVLMRALADALGADAHSVYAVLPGQPQLRQVAGTGYPPAGLDAFASIPLDGHVPIAEAARTARPVWLDDERYRALRSAPTDCAHPGGGYRAGLALPLRASGRVVGVVAASFAASRAFPADEREFAVTLTTVAAEAFQRAVEADRRRDVADTLQHSLLPAALPAIERLALATRYRPGVAGVQAGGDWYDVIALDEHRTAIVVGDVVGQGAHAAAVMGQLRSALSTILQLAAPATGPAVALAQLNRVTAGVPAARASTAVCVLIDTAAGRIRWARAGHPPPLLVDGGGVAHVLDGGSGPLLGAVGLDAPPPGPYVEDSRAIMPGDTLVLYTDGLVERRGEVVDAGIDRAATAAAAAAPAGPHHLVDRLLSAGPEGGTHDDIAVVAARVLPPPLRLHRPALPAELARLRRAVARWATAGALPEEQLTDVQLTLGEAAANAAEHAYRDGLPGTLTCTLRRLDAGAVEAVVVDHGTWRPPPADAGFRGRGLAMIEGLARDVAVEHGERGTTVRFTVPASTRPPVPAQPPAQPPPEAVPAAVRAVPEPGGGLRIELAGDLDLAAVTALRPTLLQQLPAAGPGPLVLDLRRVTYLASAAVGLLLELEQRGRERGLRPRRVREPGSVAARVLAVAGLDAARPDPAPE